ncbi:MAG TPA: GDSL-type esterase/lipase family protein [Nitrospirales bacterium]|nr:GDSL-type esterase/lipase family protein [Nitrospirales bacterium]
MKRNTKRIAVLIRDLDGTIRSSSETVMAVYGWSPEQTVGKISHELLDTRFPQPLDRIEQQLITRGQWHGKLRHVRKDGRRLTVRSRWELRTGDDQTTLVVETNELIEKSIDPELIGRLVIAFLFVVLMAGWVLLWKNSLPSVKAHAMGLMGAYLMGWLLYGFMSRKPATERRLEFTLATLSILSVVGILEVPAALGIVDYRPAFSIAELAPWHNPLYQHDDELLWVPPPHFRLSGTYRRGNLAEWACLPGHADTPYELRYDRNGFRNDPELSSARVAVVGDSYVEAPYAPVSDIFTTRLAERLAAPVANLGMSGYGPQQELATLRRFALALNPQTIVWVFFEGNDLQDTLRYNKLHDNWALHSGARFSDRSFTYNALKVTAGMLHSCTPAPEYIKRYAIVPDGRGGQVRMYFGEEPARLDARDLEALRQTGNALQAAHELTRQHGARLIVAFAPIAYRVYRDVGSFEESSSKLRSWTLNNLPERLERVVHDISPDIAYLDLTPALTDAARAGALVYLPDDTHWSSEGHDVVAATLSRVLAMRN